MMADSAHDYLLPIDKKTLVGNEINGAKTNLVGHTMHDYSICINQLNGQRVEGRRFED